MIDKINDPSALDGGEPIGLEFEIGGEFPEQLVFDAPELESGEKSQPVEIDVSGLGKRRSDEEFSIPEVYEVDKRYDTQSFIDDPSLPSPTYIPRFTSASEKYGVNGTAYKRSLASAAKKAAETVDPTSEIDEKSSNNARVVIPGAVPVKTDISDESILILKFEESKDAPTISAEEAEIEAIRRDVLVSAHPELADAPAPEPEVEASTVAEAPAEAVTDADPGAPDPFRELMLVDYTPADGDAESPSSDEAPRESSAKASLGEFARPGQRDSVKDRFLDHLMSVKIRLAGAIVLAAILLVTDVLSLFSVDVLALIGLGNVAYARAVIDLQFSVCLVLFALPEIARAIKNVGKRVFSPELVLIVSLAVVVMHDLASVFTHAADYPTFAILLAIQTVAAILSSYHRVSADFISFKLISKNTVKSFLDKRLTRTLPRENLALDGAVDEYSSRIARVFRTAFVSDFFSRTSVAVENSFNNVIMLLSSLGFAVVTAIITRLVNGNSFADFTASCAFVFLLAFPAFSMLIHKLPHHKSAEVNDAEGGAFVGEASISACSDIDVIAYDDTEVFGAEDVSIKKVHLYGKAYNAGKAMHRMYAIFSAVGGPLCSVFSASVEGDGESASDIVIEDDGISATLGSHSIAAGTLEYVKRKGIALPEDDYKTNPTPGDSTKVMYGIEDGEVYVKFFIRYSFSEEFTMLLPSLKDASIVPLIYTRDPNLTVDLFRMLTLGEDIMRVMRKYTLPSVEDKVYRRVSASIVTLGGKLDAVSMVLHAKKYSAYQSALSTSELIAMLAGTVVAVMFAVTGSLSVPMIAFGALQLVWCGYLYLRTHYIFKDKNAKDNDDVI